MRYLFEYLAFFLWTFAWLSALQIQRRYRLVHVHNMPNFLIFATLIPRLGGAKIVLDMHDPMPELFQVQFGWPVQHWFLRLLRLEEALSCRYAHYVLTVNESMRERLLQRGLSPARVQVIMNLPDPKIFKPELAQSAAPALRKSEGFALVYTGTVSPRYGLSIALEAVRALQAEMPDLHLTIIGEGPQLAELQRKAEEYDLQQRVIFQGHVPLDRIPALLAGCDAGVSPHLSDAFGELTFSTKTVEFMTMGLPVIAARTRTLVRCFDDSMLFYFEPGNADSLAQQVRRIRQQPDLVAAKKAAAQTKLKQMNWDVEKGKLLEIVAGWVTEPQESIAAEVNPSQTGGGAR